MKSYQRGFGLLLVEAPVVLCWLNFPTRHDTSGTPAAEPANAASPKSIARVFPSVSASNSTPVFPADQAASSHPVERAVTQGRLLDERAETLTNGSIKRVRLVRSDIQPSPLLVNED